MRLEGVDFGGPCNIRDTITVPSPCRCHPASAIAAAATSKASAGPPGACWPACVDPTGRRAQLLRKALGAAAGCVLAGPACGNPAGPAGPRSPLTPCTARPRGKAAPRAVGRPRSRGPSPWHRCGMQGCPWHSRSLPVLGASHWGVPPPPDRLLSQGPEARRSDGCRGNRRADGRLICHGTHSAEGGQLPGKTWWAGPGIGTRGPRRAQAEAGAELRGRPRRSWVPLSPKPDL